MRALCSLVFVCFACNTPVNDGYAVDLTVSATALSSDDVQAIATIALEATGDEGATASFPVSASFAPKREEKTIYRPGIASGVLTLTASALATDGHVVAAGHIEVTLEPGHTLLRTISLSHVTPTQDMGAGDGGGGLTLELVVGAPGGGPGKADGPAATARWTQPSVALSDGAGILYLADATNTIRKIDLTSNAVSTVAGLAGASGNVDGIALDTRFDSPGGLALDKANGILYVSDTRSLVVRKIDLATKAVLTIAGAAYTTGSADGIGGAARFKTPSGLVLMGTALYVCDSGNNAIRKIDLSTNTVTTLPLSGIGYPQAMVGDGGDHLYLLASHQIQLITLSAASVATFAGGMVGSADGPLSTASFADGLGGLTLDGTKMYVSDTSNGTIRQIDLSTSLVSTVAGSAGTVGYADGSGASARFNNPYGIASYSGTLYVADALNHVIRTVVPSFGTVATYSGSVGHPGVVDGVALQARLSTPGGIAIDSNGDLLISDTGNCTVRRLVKSSGQVQTDVGTPGTCAYAIPGEGNSSFLAEPRGMAAVGADVYFSDTQANLVRRLLSTKEANATVGTATYIVPPGSADGVGTAARVYHPHGLATDGAGHLFIADTDNQIIRQVRLSDLTVSTVAGAAGLGGAADGVGATARFARPWGIAADSAGNLYVADSGNQSIRKVVIATREVSTIAGNGMVGSADGVGTAARFYLPEALALDGKGALWIADSGNSTVRKMDVTTFAVSTVIGVAGKEAVVLGSSPGGLAHPNALAFDSNGVLHISDAGEHVVLRIHSP